LDGLWIEHFDIFYAHLVYFVSLSFIVWQFGIFCGLLF
jgi:hypothetical protein